MCCLFSGLNKPLNIIKKKYKKNNKIKQKNNQQTNKQTDSQSDNTTPHLLKQTTKERVCDFVWKGKGGLPPRREVPRETTKTTRTDKQFKEIKNKYKYKLLLKNLNVRARKEGKGSGSQ